jgi:hypothetical protein
MRVSSVKYEKLISLGNYENQKIGVVVELEPDESPAEALRRARAFVEASVQPKPTERELKMARHKVENADDYPPREVREAQEVLNRAEQDEAPF